MKKAMLYLTLLQMAVFFSSCADHGIFFPQEDIETKVFEIENFNSLDIEDNFRVFVSFGPVESVEIRANANIMRHLAVRKDGARELDIKLKPGVAVWGRETLEAHITVKELKEVDLSGNSTLEFLDDAEMEKLSLDISGNSKLEGRLLLDRLEMDASGNSRISISGYVGEINVDLSGNSKLEGFDLENDQFHGDFSGNSKAEITINEAIYLEASGNSKLTYKGNARIEYQDLSGLSKITKY